MLIGGPLFNISLGQDYCLKDCHFSVILCRSTESFREEPSLSFGLKIFVQVPMREHYQESLWLKPLQRLQKKALTSN